MRTRSTPESLVSADFVSWMLDLEVTALHFDAFAAEAGNGLLKGE